MFQQNTAKEIKNRNDLKLRGQRFNDICQKPADGYGMSWSNC